MNENDVQDREVLDYVRNRMAADMPPEFTRDVMNDVQRTPQRRRGFAWPIFTGLATVAAAAAIVIIGLGLVGRDGVGDRTRLPDTQRRRRRRRRARRREASASEQPTPSATVEATPGEGEFGPIHSMAPEEAFANAQTCQVTDAIVNAEPTDLSWAISFPEGWFTNEERTELRTACTLFGRSPSRRLRSGHPGLGRDHHRDRAGRRLHTGRSRSTQRGVHRRRRAGRALRNRSRPTAASSTDPIGRLDHRDRRQPARRRQRPAVLAIRRTPLTPMSRGVDRRARPDGRHARHRRVGMAA